jgi:hypothetical protein
VILAPPDNLRGIMAQPDPRNDDASCERARYVPPRLDRPGFRLTEFTDGYTPYQGQGRTGDGRPFYFRAEAGYWSLYLGEIGWPTELSGWPHGTAHRYFAGGTYPCEGDIRDDLGIGVPIAALTLALGDMDERSLPGVAAPEGVTLDQD